MESFLICFSLRRDWGYEYGVFKMFVGYMNHSTSVMVLSLTSAFFSSSLAIGLDSL